MTTQLQEIIDLAIVQKRNVFLSGPGGCGKTYTIKELIKYFTYNNIPYAATAITAAAACNFGGKTLHSFVFNGLGRGEVRDIVKKIPAVKKNIIRKTAVLIIDEVSMVGAKLLETVHAVLQDLKNERKKPFGGMILIVSGDFLQLPPVQDNYAFTSKLWHESEFAKVKFTTPYRFKDVKYFSMLQRIRLGVPKENDFLRLEYRRMDIYDILDENAKIRPTKIYSRKDNVAEENASELEKINLPSFTFMAEDALMYDRKGSIIPLSLMTQAELNEVLKFNVSLKIIDHKQLLDNIGPQKIVLKVTAQAMLTYNIDTENGRVNGSRCVIDKINESGVYATFIDNTSMLIPKVMITRPLQGGILVTRTQLPIALGYAITVHKCQGASLDCAVIDLGRTIFDYSQAYVALSRVRSLDGVYLTDFERGSIKSNPLAIEFENS